MSINTKVSNKTEVAHKGEYKVVFKGQLLPGYNIEQVVNNIAQLTKIPAEKIENKFFNGKVVIIRRAHDKTHAQKLQHLFTQAGLEVFILRDMTYENSLLDIVEPENFLLEKQKQIQGFIRDNKKKLPNFILDQQKVLEQQKFILIGAAVCIILALLFILI